MNSPNPENSTKPALPPFFVISLPDAGERRENITAQLNALHLPCEIVDGVYGKKLSSEELKKSYDSEKAISFPRPLARDLTLPEIGCALSHLSIYKKIIERNLPCALILEDDAIIGEETSEIVSRLATVISPDSPSIILLTYIKYYAKTGEQPLTPEHKIVRNYPKRSWARTHGYFITRKAAEVLLQNLFPVWCVADDWDCFRKNFHLDIRAVVPYCIGFLDVVSHLEEERAKSVALQRKNQKHPFSFYLKDYLWRRAIHRLCILPFAAKKQNQKQISTKLSEESHSRRILNEYYHAQDKPCPKTNRKLLIYMADGRPGAGHVGGLADRFRGMVSMYSVARKLGIDFKINMTSPSDLTDYLLPDKYNWLLAENEISYDPEQSIILSIRAEDALSKEKIHEKIKHYFEKYDQIHITTNVRIADKEYGERFNELFKPAPELETRIKDNLEKTGDDFISVTFRFQQLLGDFVENEKDYPILIPEKRRELISRCISHLEEVHSQNAGKKILVTSDSITFLGEAGKKDYVHVIPGKVVHVSCSLGLNKEVYMKSFVDYFLLTHSKKVYQVVEGQMYNSGFPKRAALHNKIPYVIKKYNVIPRKKWKRILLSVKNFLLRRESKVKISK